MFDEPYRWIDAIHQRRDYIAEQINRATPVVGLSVREGILLATFHRQNPKLYEIYDRIAMGGIGHPADLETVRELLLNMAHVEGYQRSAFDVSIERLALFGIAPRLKAAFEDIAAPPLILDVLLAEVGQSSKEDLFLQVSFDGNLQRSKGLTVLAPSDEMSSKMDGLLEERLPPKDRTLDEVLPVLSRVFMEILYSQEELGMDGSGNVITPDKLEECKSRLFKEKSWEGVLLDRTSPARVKKVIHPEDMGR